MKKISCEACGSNELTKQGDYFICDYCHTSHYIGNENGSNTNESQKENNAQPEQTVEVQSAKKEHAPMQQPYATNQRNEAPKGPLLKKILGFFLIFAGFSCFTTFGEHLSTGDFYLFFAMLFTAVALLNGGFTLAFNKEVFLTKKFSVGQLFLALLGVVVMLAIIFGLGKLPLFILSFLVLLALGFFVVSTIRKAKK
ncbi:hypothetical protein [Enterococcus sp. LJL51]|uniref:TFIIB-type zinc finger domain-containing protein n=1 Tax=Enterococcus sp. LJL51 TaxID=3416656 RepID=UPI003CEC6098